MAAPYLLSSPDRDEHTAYMADQTGAKWYLRIVSCRRGDVAIYDGVISEVEFTPLDGFPGAAIMTTRPNGRRYRQELAQAPRRSAAALESARGEFAEFVRLFKDRENLILKKFDPLGGEKMNNEKEDKEAYLASLVAIMDDEIREEVHADLAPCTVSEFLLAYCERHREKYGEDFPPQDF